MKFIYLFFVLFLSILPCLYYKRSKAAIMFLWLMCVSDKCRRLYSKVLLVILLAFHFFIAGSGVSAISLAVSSALMISYVLAGRKRDLLACFRASSKRQFVLFLLTLASCFIPGFLSVSVTLGFMLAAVCLYPSIRFRCICSFKYAGCYFHRRHKEFVAYYRHMTAEDERRVASEIRTLNLQQELS